MLHYIITINFKFRTLKENKRNNNVYIFINIFYYLLYKFGILL